MSETVKRTLRLTFPQHLAGDPILFEMASAHELLPTIRRAHLANSGGEVLLEIEGTAENVEKGIEYLRGRGVIVAPADEDAGAQR